MSRRRMGPAKEQHLADYRRHGKLEPVLIAGDCRT